MSTSSLWEYSSNIPNIPPAFSYSHVIVPVLKAFKTDKLPPYPPIPPAFLLEETLPRLEHLSITHSPRENPAMPPAKFLTAFTMLLLWQLMICALFTAYPVMAPTKLYPFTEEYAIVMSWITAPLIYPNNP